MRRAAAWTSSKPITRASSSSALHSPPSRRATSRVGRERRRRPRRPRGAAGRRRSCARAGAPGGRRPRAAAGGRGWRSRSARTGPARGAGRSATPRPRRRCRARRPRVAATDAASTSQPVTGAKPSLAAAIASTPEPQPQSASAPPGSSSISSASERRVVSWAPVPNACAGSIATSIVPGRASSHGGRTRSARPPASTTTAGCHVRQRTSQSSSSSVVETSTSAGAGRRLEVGQRRQLAGRAVDRELDGVLVDVALLQAAGRRARPARRARARRARAPRGSRAGSWREHHRRPGALAAAVELAHPVHVGSSSSA